MIYAEVAVDIRVPIPYTYHVPPEMEGLIDVGHLVEVEVRTKKLPGIVVRLHTEPLDFVTKPIIDRLDPHPVVTPDQIDFARWMSAVYYAPLSACLWLMLPPGIAGSRDMTVTLLDEMASSPDAAEQAVIDLLRRKGTQKGTQLTQKLAGVAWRPAVEALAKAQVVRVERIIKPSTVKPKMVKMVVSAITTEQIPGIQWGKAKHIERYEHVLRFLTAQTDPLSIEQLCKQTGADRSDVDLLAKRGLVVYSEVEVLRDSLADRDFVLTSAPQLTDAQQSVFDQIAPHIEQQSHAAFLLHGITGSGKTEIYLRAIEATLRKGRQAVLLVPEIALTGQTIRRVASRFPGQVAVVHGQLDTGERYDTWRRAREARFPIVVGARSALFTPFPDVGLIILDEEHDHSYKDEWAQRFTGYENFHLNPPPSYHARQVAEELVRRSGGVLILGSATPDIETYYRAQSGDLRYLHLPNRIMGHRTRIHQQAERAKISSRYTGSDDALTIDLPPVQVVDMRAELKAGNTHMFSRPLYQAVKQTLERGEQAILFLNRRGQNTYVFCRDCGYVAACTRCDTPLTYHSDETLLSCHRCGFKQPQPEFCPMCKSRRIRYFGAGTQQVEAALRDTFPLARAVRWDADAASTPGAHEEILQRFVDRKADVMIGTQMIAKGLDLPLVTLVGVVSADTGLALPDFRAGERAFQLLTQVAGRAGRGILGGKVILQTYQPGHYAIQAAAQHDYARFYQREIAFRRELGYPPFRRLARIEFRANTDAKARALAENCVGWVAKKLHELKMTGTEIIGPAPCFFHRVNRWYRWHIILRGPDPARALVNLDLPLDWFVDIDPLNVL